MITKSIQISDGVKINHIKTDKFKTNYLSFNFIAPLSRESVHFNALIPLILMRACEKYPSQALINKRLQYLYAGDISARNSTYGEYQIFGMRANMLADRYTPDTKITKEMVNLLCEMIFKPYLVNGVFDSEFTKGEKTNLIDTIEAEVNDKGQYALKRMRSEMFKNEVFSISCYGEIEDVKKITPKSLYEAYKKALSTYQIEIYFVGEGNFDGVAEAFKSEFEKIDRRTESIPTVELKAKATEVKEIVDVEKVNQGKLVMGFRSGYHYSENKYHLIQLFNEILGASPISKLFMNVREKMSLCYYCRSAISQREGTLTISSGVEAKNMKVAKDAILEQIEAIKKGEITEEEFANAKKSIKNGYLTIYDSQVAMENWAFLRGLCGITTTPLLECEKIKDTTIEEIMNVAKKVTLDTVYFLRGEKKEGENE